MTGVQTCALPILKKNEILKADNFDAAAILRNDVNGNPIYTLWKWVAEADWIGEFGKNHPDSTLVNATEGGIGFPGIVNMSLEKCVERYLAPSYDLHTRVAGEILSSPMPEVKRERLIELTKEMDSSLKRCADDLQVLIEETDFVKGKLKKDKSQAMQTGRAALFESDLAEEPAYRYILEIFNDAYSRVLNREFRSLANLKSEIKKKLGKLEINKKRLIFLRDVALLNRELIRLAFEMEGL